MSITPEDPPAEQEQIAPVMETAPARPTFIKNELTGATFSWTSPEGRTYVPEAGDPNFLGWAKAFEAWNLSQFAIYQASPKYQADQAAANPDIASGRLPAVGFIAEAPNAWGVPVGARVTSLTPIEGGGYEVGLDTSMVGATPHQVKVEGPGYSIETTVLARNSQEAALKVNPVVYTQGYRDLTPVTGIMQGPGGQTVIQRGDPETNAFWVSKGLPQFAAYEIPRLTPEAELAGNYIKSITGAPGGPLIEIGNKTYEKGWEALGVTDLATVQGYAPPELPAGAKITDLVKSSAGLNVLYSVPGMSADLAAAESNSPVLGEGSDLMDMGAPPNLPRLQDFNYISPEAKKLLEQRSVFDQAFLSGQIKDPAKYQEALSFNAKQLNALGYELVQPGGISGPVAPTKGDPGAFSLLPKDPTSIAFQERGTLWVKEGYKADLVSSQDIGGFIQKTYSITPINQANMQSSLPKSVLEGNVFGGTGILGVKPVIDSPEKATMALSLMATVIAPMIGPSLAAQVGVQGLTAVKIVGAGVIQVGISQSFKAVQGGGLLTPGEAAESMAMGEGLAIGGSMINQALRIAGPGVTNAALRVSTYGGMGAALSGGQEFIETGKVTPINVALGAGAGAALGGAGEIAGLGLVRAAPKVQTRLNESFLSTEPGQKWQPGLTEKALMAVTGQKPEVSRGLVGTGVDVDMALMDQGFIKPPEAKLSSSDRLILEKATGFKNEAMPEDFLTSFKKPSAETLTPEARAETKLLADRVLGKEESMPVDFLEAFNKSPKGSERAAVLAEAERLASTPAGKAEAKLYTRATTEFNESLAFGTEKPWAAKAPVTPELKSSELPNLASQELNNIAWDLSLAPGASTIAIPKTGELSGSRTSFSPVESLGSSLVSQVTTLNTELSEPKVQVTAKAKTESLPVIIPEVSIPKSSDPLLIPVSTNIFQSQAAKPDQGARLVEYVQPAPFPGTQRARKIEEELLIPISYPPGVSNRVDQGPQLIPVNLKLPGQTQRRGPGEILINIPTQAQDQVGKGLTNSILVPFSGAINQAKGRHDSALIPKDFTPGVVQLPDVALEHRQGQKGGLKTLELQLQEVTPKLPPGLTQRPTFKEPNPGFPGGDRTIGATQFPGGMDFKQPHRRASKSELDLLGSLKRVHPIAEPGVWFAKTKRRKK